jgi:hypothetical protein
MMLHNQEYMTTELPNNDWVVWQGNQEPKKIAQLVNSSVVS